jgi:PPM family protein phosphatase
MQLSHIDYLYEIGGKKNQEDYIWPVSGAANPDSRVFIVCDGVGGSENGEIASRIISESMGAALKDIPVANITDQLIHERLTAAKRGLADYARTHQLSPDMATTFSLLVLGDTKSFIAWCGDSRVYHLRNGAVLYKTSDHSLVNTLLKKGEISEAEALSHPQKNVILKAIKADDSPVEVEHQWIGDIRPGDYFLLATDGLFENISEKEIKTLLDRNDRGGFNE